MAATVELSHPDRVFFPQAGITKGDLVEHHRAVAGGEITHLLCQEEQTLVYLANQAAVVPKPVSSLATARRRIGDLAA